MIHRPAPNPTSSPIRRARQLLAVLLLAPFVAGTALAADEDEEVPPILPFFPFQISIAPSYAQIMPSNVPIYGFGINVIYGVQHRLYGIDAGLFNDVEQSFVGAELGVINLTRGDAAGVQAGVGNAAEGGMTGLMLGGVNFAQREFSGAQLGAANNGEKVTGAQIGIFNYAQDLKGIQFGLLNFNSKGPLFFLPIVNFGW